jgi:hypothetical protein
MRQSSLELVGEKSGRKTVVVTLWRDAIVDGNLLTYQQKARNRGQRPGAGSKEQLANLIWARDHCNGLIRVSSSPRKMLQRCREALLIPFQVTSS